jgi:hypothetical protein
VGAEAEMGIEMVVGREQAEQHAADSSEGLDLCISPDGAARFVQQMRDRTGQS